MDFGSPDAIAPFVSSLKVNDQTATSITKILNDSGSVQKSGAASQPFNTAGIACAISKLVFGKSALLDQTAIEPVVEKSWTKTCWLQPKCIITPHNSVQVSQALKIASFLRTGFSVRSGGHSPNPGWASVANAVLIDLGSLNRTQISQDQKTVSVGPGAKWTDVVAYLDPFGVTALAGRQPFVGVGGYSLGGGVSHFAPEYGLAADTLQNAEVVLADGSIVQANPTTNADLFWALKGGGANFGIVTSFDLRTVPIKDIWFQSSLYGPDQAHALLDAFAAFQQVDDPKASVILSLSPTFGTVGLVYAAPVAQPAAFNAFYSVPVLQAALPGTLGTVLQLNNIIASLQNPAPQRHDYRGVSTKVDAQLYKDVYDFWVQKAVEVGQKTGANATFVPQHIAKGTVDVGYANGGNPLGLSRETQQWWTTIMDWEKPEDDDLVRSLGIETTAKWVELSKQRGLDLPFIYMNDASRDQNPLGSYAPENIARLKAIAKKYDPSGVFQKVQNGGFLLKDV